MLTDEKKNRGENKHLRGLNTAITVFTALRFVQKPTHEEGDLGQQKSIRSLRVWNQKGSFALFL